VGLERRGFSRETQRELKRAYRAIYGSRLNVTQALEALKSNGPNAPEVGRLIAFIEASERGITL
jgi:UDP-N-acetylglucosamine acyltransferase